MKEDILCSVASVPCIETLKTNKDAYNKIFDNNKTNIVIECSHPMSWYEHTNNVIGISSFGESGKGDVLLDHFGFSLIKRAKGKRNNMKLLSDIDLSNKKVGIRLDLNVPVKNGEIQSDERLKPHCQQSICSK